MLVSISQGDGTDLKIVSSNDIDVTGDLDVVGGVTSTLVSTLASASGITTIGSTTAATFSAAGLLILIMQLKQLQELTVLYRPTVV